MLNIIEQFLFRLGGNNLRITLARKWGVKVGNGCFINPPCRFGVEPYLISIGDDCVLSGNNTFITHDGAIRIFLKTEAFKEIGTLFGPIAIRDNCFVGFGSTILPNVIIGPNSVVGTGSIITKNVPPKTVFAGNPAKFICTYDEFMKKCKLRSTGNIPRILRKNTLKEMFKETLNG